MRQRNCGELQLGGVVRRLGQVAFGGAQIQQFFLIVVHGVSSFSLMASMSSDYEYQAKDPK